jgi:hypothetical protein
MEFNMSRITTWWGSRSRRTKIVIVGIVALLAFGSASSAGAAPATDADASRIADGSSAPSPTAATPSVDPTSTAAPTSTVTPIAATAPATPVPTPEATPPPTPAATAPAAPAATPVPAIAKASGRGDKIVKFAAQDAPTYARITTKGGGNFAVVSYAGSEYGDLLVNVIGAYAGWVYIEPGMNRLKVSASGSWTIEIRPIASAKHWDGTSRLTGKGDYVVNLTGSAFGITTIKNKGNSNFAVVAYSEEGDYLDLLVNEIGSYGGEVMLPLADPIVLSIHAVGGTWSFSAVEQ